jgi:phosphotriesterase-related protein
MNSFKKACGMFACLGLALLTGCSQESEPVILTVNGPVPVSELGITLSHEHVLVDFIGADSTGYQRWDRQKVIEKVVPYLNEIQEYNVSTLIECTPVYVGRDPWILKELSRQTGMNLLTNTGYYGASDNLYLPEHFYSKSAGEIAEIWVQEFEQGIEGSGVRPGFIKIAVGESDTLSMEHVKIITAAALAHKQTGLVIASHTGPDGPAFAQLRVLKSQGVDPSSFIWVHAQRGTLEGNIRAAEMGSWISLDNVNTSRQAGSMYDIQWYAKRIMELKNAGYLDHVLISHDAGWYNPDEENGGPFRGYTGIFTGLLPALKTGGFTSEDIDQLLKVNPANAFKLRK